MQKFMTLGIELPEGADYPDIRFNSEVHGGRLVSASVHNLFDESLVKDQIIEIAVDALSDGEYEAIHMARGRIEALLEGLNVGN